MKMLINYLQCVKRAYAAVGAVAANRPESVLSDEDLVGQPLHLHLP